METGEALREFVKKSPIYCKVGKVTAVDGSTCEVTLVEDENVVFKDVRLKAHVEGDKSIVIKPQMNSFVLIGLLSSTDAFLAMYDQVDSISVKMFDHVLLLDKNGLSQNVSSGKFQFKNDQVSMVDLFSTIMDIISKLTVTTPSGNSTTPLPPTMQAIEQFKLDLKKFLK